MEPDGKIRDKGAMKGINRTKTIAEILKEKSPEERAEWMRKDSIQEEKSSEIEGLHVPSETILDEFKKQRLS